MALEWAGPALVSLVIISGIFAYVSTKLSEENGWLKFLFLFVALSYAVLTAYGAAAIVGEAATNLNTTVVMNTTNSYINVTEVDTQNSCTLGFVYANNGTCSGVGANFAQTITYKNVPVLSTSTSTTTSTTPASTSATSLQAIMLTAGLVLLFVILILAAYIAVKLLTGVKDNLKEAGDRLVNDRGK